MDLAPDSLDRLVNDPDKMAKYVLDNIKPGSIVLMYKNKTTRKALPIILEGIKQKGYKMAMVSDLLAKGNPMESKVYR